MIHYSCATLLDHVEVIYMYKYSPVPSAVRTGVGLPASGRRWHPLPPLGL